MSNINKTRKTVLITGVTSGIGRELTHLFAADCYNLILVARSREKLATFEEELRQKYLHISVQSIVQDLGEPHAPEAIYSAVKNMGIQVDILVNNAGFNIYGSLEKTNVNEHQQLIQVNSITPTVLTKLFLQDMVDNKFGKILFLGSTASYCPAIYSAVYCASKAYILRFSESLSMELQGSGVTVTCLCPGATKTEFAAKANLTKTRLFNMAVMDAKSVAQIGYRTLMGNRPLVISGWLNNLLVESMKFTPRCLYVPMTRYLMAER